MQSTIIENNSAPANVPVVNEAHNVMSLILSAGDSIDPVKLEKMMDLHDRLLNRQKKEAFAADFIRMKPALPKIIRMKENTQTQSRYAPLEDINTQIDPILSQHGFGTSTKIINQTPTSVTVRAELWHRDGHIEETEIIMPLDNCGAQGTINKTGPHATSSSVTYARRVAICALLQISTGDDLDGNKAQDNEVLDNETAVALDQRINKLADAQTYKPKFLKYMKYESVKDIKKIDLKKAQIALETKENDAKKGAK